MTPEFVALVLVGAFGLLNYFGLLPRRRSASEAAAEILIANERGDRLAAELEAQKVRVTMLEQTRSLEPILDRLDKNAELQAKVLDRLAHHNGSFRHMEESLALIHQGFETLTGFVSSLEGLPVDGGRGPNLIEKPQAAQRRRAKADTVTREDG